jgi:hypothetical protein
MKKCDTGFLSISKRWKHTCLLYLLVVLGVANARAQSVIVENMDGFTTSPITYNAGDLNDEVKVTCSSYNQSGNTGLTCSYSNNKNMRPTGSGVYFTVQMTGAATLDHIEAYVSMNAQSTGNTFVAEYSADGSEWTDRHV